MPNIPVAIFNANQVPVQVTVNNGNQFTIPGTGPSQNWQPQQPNPNPLSFTNGYPAPNTFGTMAPNQVLLYSNGSPVSQPLHINIPQSAPIFSLQLYIFFGWNTSVSWALLSSGQPVAWGTSMSNVALKAAAKAQPPAKAKPSRSSSKKASKKR